MDGRFTEHQGDPHVRLRAELLDQGAVLAPPPAQTNAISAVDLRSAAEQALDQLHRHGVVVVELAEPPDDDAYIKFGEQLGQLIPERDPAVTPYAYGETLLNLRTTHGLTSDVSLQPFATNSLTLHTEGSGRPVEEQPRYISLLCVDPGDNAAESQTVLVPMAPVLNRISSADLELLTRVRYRRNTRGPFLVRSSEGRHVLSMRDFTTEPLEWTCTDDSVAEERVNSAIRSLLAAMYAMDTATGVHWRPGMLVIIDNTYFIHGRTAGPAAAPNRQRHLKRLRIV